MKETLKRNPEESYKEYLTRVAAYIALLKKQGLLNEADEASNIAFWEIFDIIKEMVECESRRCKLDDQTQEAYMTKVMNVAPKLIYKFNNPEYMDDKYEGKQFEVKTFFKSRTQYCIREAVASVLEITPEEAKVLLKIRSARAALASENDRTEDDITVEEIFTKLGEKISIAQITELILIEKGKESYNMITEQGIEKFRPLGSSGGGQESYDIDEVVFGKSLDDDVKQIFDGVFAKMSRLEIYLLLKNYGVLGEDIRSMDMEDFVQDSDFKRFFAEDTSIRSRKDPVKTAYNKNVKIEKAIAAMAMQVAERRYNVDGGLEEYLFGLLEDK